MSNGERDFQLFRECMKVGQAAVREPDSAAAEELRDRLRELARQANVRIRTAYVDEVVMVVRIDAEIWNWSAPVMREKLTPPDLPLT